MMYIQHRIFDAFGGDEAVACEVFDEGCVRGTGGSPGHSVWLLWGKGWMALSAVGGVMDEDERAWNPGEDMCVDAFAFSGLSHDILGLENAVVFETLELLIGESQ